MKRHLLPAALAVLCAVLALGIASTASPLYATNFWTDVNLYFTIGRGMTEGLMPYRDLFDHKGPLIFMLYALGALVSDTGFIGVFLLEILSLAAALFFGCRIVCLRGAGKWALASIPLLAMVTVCAAAFTQGGSAEEFCLPALVLALYAALRVMQTAERGAALYAAFGAAAAWVFLIKYTVCGLFFGLGLCLLGHALCTGGLRRAARMIGAMLAGFLALVVPVALYLLANGALWACIEVYFVQNLFVYSGTPMTLTAHLYNALAYLRTQSIANPAVALLAGVGCAAAFVRGLASRRKSCLFEALAAPVGAGLLLLLVYWGEMAHPYYAIVFAALCPLGLMPLGALAARWRGRAALASLCALCAAIVPVCHALCQATPLMRVQREDMPQVRFAQIMNAQEGATLLDLTSLDQGFYLAAGITPNVRYFADNNLQTEEKLSALAGYLEDGVAQFVVTRYKDPGAGYRLIAEAEGVFDLNDRRAYKLYQRIDAQ